MDIMWCVEEASKECLSMSGDIKKQSNKLKVTPGWSEHVRPYSEESKFWFATWKSAGSPSEGELYN